MKVVLKNRNALVLAAVLAAAAAGLFVAAVPRPPQVVDLGLDASDSVGADYTNVYLPAISKVLPVLVGKQVRVRRFGAAAESLFEGKLTPKDATDLREFLLTTRRYPPTVTGSAISDQALQQVRWLREQRGGRKALVLFTDGMEQETGQPAGTSGLKKGFATGVTAVIAFPRPADPHVAEVLRLGGAKVVVAQRPEQVQRVLDAVVLGVKPARVALVLLAYMLLASALLCALSSLGVVRQEVTEAPAPFVEEPVVLAPLTVLCRAEVVGTESLWAQRRLECGSGRLAIARDGAMPADLSLPVSLLGPAPDVALWVTPLTLNRFSVRNLGMLPLVANGRTPVRPGDPVEVAGIDGLDLALSPGLKVRVTAKAA